MCRGRNSINSHVFIICIPFSSSVLYTDNTFLSLVMYLTNLQVQTFVSMKIEVPVHSCLCSVFLRKLFFPRRNIFIHWNWIFRRPTLNLPVRIGLGTGYMYCGVQIKRETHLGKFTFDVASLSMWHVVTLSHRLQSGDRGWVSTSVRWQGLGVNLCTKQANKSNLRHFVLFCIRVFTVFLTWYSQMQSFDG